MSDPQHSNNDKNKKRGLDILLTQSAKSCAIGESISFRLIKGPATAISQDPVDPKAPAQAFPLVAKFPESVVKPDFHNIPWIKGRLYQQDIPKPEDSDDEDEVERTKKKRWRYNRTTGRQWILQEEVDFLETMVAKRERGNTKASQDSKKLSSRYEGVPEHNASRYAIFSVADDDDDAVHIQTLPSPYSTIPFAQPAVRHSLTLSQAEQAIQDQRTTGVLRRPEQADRSMLRVPSKPANTSKNRLLNKLKSSAAADDDDDDVMGDVTFRSRKGGGGKARRELLSLADGVAVSDEGVLGGTNDATFGGKGRFGQINVESEEATNNVVASNGGEAQERGADGAAMADDFYQRDVKAEYEELDYDANEQFDDDDVDLGESEMVVDADGFGDEDDEDELDEAEEEEEVVTGAVGLATAAGFREMLAKARGEAPVQTAAQKRLAAEAKQQARDSASVDDNNGDHMSKILKAAEAANTSAQKDHQTEVATSPAEEKEKSLAIQVDDKGQRVINLEDVRREIWLNHGSIPMKRLMKMFDIKKKSSQERQAKFREVVKELCIMKTDPVGGRVLVLKQHYSNMG